MDDNCYVEPVQKIVTDEERQKVEMALLTVWGMRCPNCAARVRNSLLSLSGVVNVCIDHTVGIAGVVFNPELATVKMLINAVANAGSDGRHEYGARLLSWEALQ